jgi:hypothetical protein
MEVRLQTTSLQDKRRLGIHLVGIEVEAEIRRKRIIREVEVRIENITIKRGEDILQVLKGVIAETGIVEEIIIRMKEIIIRSIITDD